MAAIPESLWASLKEPLENYDVASVTSRLDRLCHRHWEHSYSIRELGKIQLQEAPGKSTGAALPFLEVSCTLVIHLAGEGSVEYRSSVLSLSGGSWTEERLKELAFLNTAVREASIGRGELSLSEITFTSCDGSLQKPDTDLGDIIIDGRTLELIETAPPREDFEEKRKTPRKLLPLQDSVPIQMRSHEGHEELNIFLLDISRSGMRIISDYDFHRDENYSLKLCIEEACELDAQVTWKKDLWEGMYFIGFQFQDMEKEEFEKVCRYLEGFSSDDRREHFRMERDMLLELFPRDREEKLYSLILDLSISGMKASYKGRPFEESSLTDCRIFIGFEEDSIEVVAETVWSRAFENNTSVSAFKFVGTGEHTQKRLQKLIEQCILTNLHEALDEITAPAG